MRHGAESRDARHDRIVVEVVEMMVLSPIEAGGDVREVLELLESVITAILAAVIRPGKEQRVLGQIMQRVEPRLEAICQNKAAAARIDQ